MGLALLLGSISGMIDKITLKEISVQQMQFWVNLITAILYTTTYFILKTKEGLVRRFRWYIPWINDNIKSYWRIV